MEDNLDDPRADRLDWKAIESPKGMSSNGRDLLTERGKAPDKEKPHMLLSTFSVPEASWHVK